MDVVELKTTSAINKGRESWLSNASALATEAIESSSTNLKHRLGVSYEQHPVLTSVAVGVIGLAVGLPLVRYGGDNIGARVLLLAKKEIHTADPFRTLIDIRGYGGRKLIAVRMEDIVARTRNQFISGDLRTAADVEQAIARQYMPGMRGEAAAEARIYDHANTRRKHRSYLPAFQNLTAEGHGEHIATAAVNNKNYRFIRTLFDPSNHGASWEFSRTPETAKVASKRIEHLFVELVELKGEKSGTVLQSQLERVAELEWLNAQTWKYSRGSAGVSQLEARTWLEMAGIDSGRFHKGLDPNLEALTRTLPNFKAAYPSFFKQAPSFFKTTEG